MTSNFSCFFVLSTFVVSKSEFSGLFLGKKQEKLRQFTFPSWKSEWEIFHLEKQCGSLKILEVSEWNLIEKSSKLEIHDIDFAADKKEHLIIRILATNHQFFNELSCNIWLKIKAVGWFWTTVFIWKHCTQVVLDNESSELKKLFFCFFHPEISE